MLKWGRFYLCPRAGFGGSSAYLVPDFGRRLNCYYDAVVSEFKLDFIGRRTQMPLLLYSFSSCFSLSMLFEAIAVSAKSFLETARSLALFSLVSNAYWSYRRAAAICSFVRRNLGFSRFFICASRIKAVAGSVATGLQARTPPILSSELPSCSDF